MDSTALPRTNNNIFALSVKTILVKLETNCTVILPLQWVFSDKEQHCVSARSRVLLPYLMPRTFYNWNHLIGKKSVGPRLHVKLDCTEECHWFICTKHPLTPIVNLWDILNLPIQNVFYVQSGVDQKILQTDFNFWTAIGTCEFLWPFLSQFETSFSALTRRAKQVRKTKISLTSKAWLHFR